MRYRSSRGASPAVGFGDALLGGLAPDGGLYLPERWPQLTAEAGADSSPASPERSYESLAVSVMAPFVEGEIEADDFAALVAESYATFDHPEVCPLVRIDERHWLLELFHGPTLAFKDVALQLVGRLFDHELRRRDERVTIVAATSGDTGSAAMQAVRGLDRVDIVVLYPYGRTTEVQRRQMTTLDEPNVHAVAIDGTFDDCQDLVKAMFADAAFARRVRLGAVNSINWARVMAQIVYYAWAQRRVSEAMSAPARASGSTEASDSGVAVTFCVPTGNFGNVYAGHAARRMGLPIRRLMVASNTNDVLTRLIASGELATAEVVSTLSPSMDIQISSNLERLLHELFDGDGEATASFLARFRSHGRVSLSGEQHRRLAAEFSGACLDDDDTIEVMRRTYERTGRLIDPHTAVGVGAAERLRRSGEPLVTLSTAHPSKFPDAVVRATKTRPELPEHLADLMDRPERSERLPADLEAVRRCVEAASSAG